MDDAEALETFGRLGGEANYAFGGMSSFTETNAVSGSINITNNNPMGAIDGTVSATYAQGSIMGGFHADFCPAAWDTKRSLRVPIRRPVYR